MNTHQILTAAAVVFSSTAFAQDTPETTPPTTATWAIGRCSFTGQLDGSILRQATGECGALTVYASEVTAEPSAARNAVIKAGDAVVFGAHATWDQNTVTLPLGRLQATDWVMSASEVEISLDTAKVTMRSPGSGR